MKNYASALGTKNFLRLVGVELLILALMMGGFMDFSYLFSGPWYKPYLLGGLGVFIVALALPVEGIGEATQEKIPLYWWMYCSALAAFLLQLDFSYCGERGFTMRLWVLDFWVIVALMKHLPRSEVSFQLYLLFDHYIYHNYASAVILWSLPFGYAFWAWGYGIVLWWISPKLPVPKAGKQLDLGKLARATWRPGRVPSVETSQLTEQAFTALANRLNAEVATLELARKYNVLTANANLHRRHIPWQTIGQTIGSSLLFLITATWNGLCLLVGALLRIRPPVPSGSMKEENVN